MLRLATYLTFVLLILYATTSDAQPGRLLKSNTYPGTVTAIGSGPTFYPVGVFEDQNTGLTTFWGTCSVGINYFDVCGTRLDPRGTRDLSFGSSGLVVVSQPSINSTVEAVGKRSSGGYLIGGGCDAQVCLTATTAQGSVDQSFGAGGRVVPQMRRVVSIHNLSNGKYLVVGLCESSASNNTFCVERYLQNGATDVTYGNSGRRIVSDGPLEYIVSSALDASGRLLLGGTCVAIQYYACVWRVTEAGNLDTAWGINGKRAAFNGPNSSQASAITVQGDFVYAVGSCYLSASGENGSCVSKLSINSSDMPPIFGNSGTLFVAGDAHSFHSIRLDMLGNVRALITSLSNGTQLLIVDASGNSARADGPMQSLDLPFAPNVGEINSTGVTLVASATYNGVGFTFSRFREDGQPDRSLDRAGWLYAVSGDAYSSIRWARPIPTHDGGWYGIIECGNTRPGDQFAANAACVVKMNADGSQSRTFGKNAGWAYVPSGIQTFGAVAGVIDGTSHLYVLHECNAPLLSFCVTKLTPAGVIETSYANEGTASISASGLYYANDVAIDSQNRLLVSGACAVANGIRPCIVRLASDGQIDTSFADAGRKLVDAAPISGLGGANLTMKLRLFTDDSILLGKVCLDGTMTSVLCVTKLTADGAFHSDFGGIEYVTPIAATALNDLLIENGTVIVLAQCDFRTCILKLTTAGLVDSSAFPAAIAAADGVIRLDPASPTTPIGYSLASQRGGRIAVGGTCRNDPGQVCVALYLPNGAPDVALGVDGSTRFGIGQSFVTNPTIAALTHSSIVVSALCEETLLPTEFSLGGIREACHARLATVASSRFDLDNDYVESAVTDGIVYLRHLFGFTGESIVANAVSHYGARTESGDITAYMSQINPAFPACTSAIVGLPTGASATVDGLVLLRAMLGLSGQSVMSGINFPAGTLRTTWNEVKNYLVSDCGIGLRLR
jgi:uncharacterized delta-60 repeat protein